MIFCSSYFLLSNHYVLTTTISIKYFSEKNNIIKVESYPVIIKIFIVSFKRGIFSCGILYEMIKKWKKET